MRGLLVAVVGLAEFGEVPFDAAGGVCHVGESPFQVRGSLKLAGTLVRCAEDVGGLLGCQVDAQTIRDALRKLR